MSHRKAHNKQFVTSAEHARSAGGFKKKASKGMFRPLPFDCCALSLTPFKDPVMTPSGNVFDILNIVPFIQQHHVDPISGEDLTLKQLTKLHFHKSPDGKGYWCPMLHKQFTEFSHIIAIRTSGHVYSYDALKQVMLKTMKCSETGKPFAMTDIVTLQNPADPQRRNIASFHHIKTGMTADGSVPSAGVRSDPSMRKVMKQLEKSQKEQQKAKRRKMEEEKVEAEKIPPAKSTTRRGVVKMYTTNGTLQLELFCDKAPLTCENFLLLCERGYYKGIKFHRLIPGFMIQGGDPTATGTGGQSAWEKPFQDEIDPSLHHNVRGLLSMANAGPGTNKSQFFILFAPKVHLDGKHSIFGRVQGGLETLDSMEATPTNNADLPLLDIVITDVAVIYNPFAPENMAEEKKLQEKKLREEKRAGKASKKKAEWFSNPSAAYEKPKVVKAEGIGKYLDKSKLGKGSKDTLSFGGIQPKARTIKRKKKSDFGSVF